MTSAGSAVFVPAAAIPVCAVLALDPGGLAPFGPAKWALLTTCVAAALAVVVVAGGGIRWVRPSRLAIAWAAFLAIVVVAAARGVDPLYAWIGTPERHFGVLGWVVCAAAFVVGRRVGAAGRGREIVVAACVATVGPLGAWVVAETLGWRPLDLVAAGARPVATLGSSAYLGAAAALLTPIAVGWASGRGRAAGFLGWVAAGLGGFALVASGARAAWVGSVVAVVAAAAFARRRRVFGDARVVLAAAGAVIVVVVGSALATGVAGRVGDTFADRQGGAKGRLDEWRVATRVVLAHPLTGVGPEGYRIAFGRAVDDDYERTHGRDPLPDRAHSVVLDVAATTGVPGLAAYAALLVATGLGVRRAAAARAAAEANERAEANGTPERAAAAAEANDTPERAAAAAEANDTGKRAAAAAEANDTGKRAAAAAAANGTGKTAGASGTDVGIAVGLLAYATQALFLFPIAELEPVAWLLAGLVIARTPTDAHDRPRRGPRTAAPTATAAALAGIAAAAFVAGSLDIRADRAARRTMAAAGRDRLANPAEAASLRPDQVRYRLVAARAHEAVGSSAGLDRAIEELDRATDLSRNDPVVRGEGARLLLQRAQRTETAKRIDEARAALEALRHDDPRNATVLLRTGVARALDGDDEGAERAWRRAEYLAPTRAAASVDLALLYARQGRWPDARAAARRAIAREPDNPEAIQALRRADSEDDGGT